jgi:hypothetical protein
MLRRGIRVIVPVAIFIAGVLAQLLADRLTNKEVNTPTRIISVALGCVVVVLVVLAIVVSVDFSDRTHQLNLLTAKIEELSHRFGISVEFVSDHPGPDDGMTYERTRQLVSNAKRSLVFVDFWTETGTYRSDQEPTHDRRRTYYEEILNQIQTRTRHYMDGDTPFHRRIIQADLGESSARITLRGDDSFFEYLRQCLSYQAVSPRATVLKVCRPHIHLHFAIIDDRFVILPILTTDSSGQGVRRHGALIFEDRVGDLVSRLMYIFQMLDAAARPLTEGDIEHPRSARASEL